MTFGISNLTDVRSQYSENIIKFLEQYANTLNEPPPFVKSLGVDLLQLEVEQWVWTEKRDILPERDSFERNEIKEFGERSELEKFVQELYEIRGEGREERWSNVVKRPRSRLIMLGAPGQGKTFSTKATVLKQINQTLSQIKDFEQNIEEVSIAIWIKASAFAKTGCDNLFDSLIEAMKLPENQTPIHACDSKVEKWLRQRLNSQDALVIIDSL